MHRFACMLGTSTVLQACTSTPSCSPPYTNAQVQALERTQLAWQRTALAFANLAVTVAQLFRLSLPGSGSPYVARLHDFGIPLSAACTGLAILICSCGCVRFFRQQEAMVYSKSVWTGGWNCETTVIGLATLMVSYCTPLVQAGLVSERDRVWGYSSGDEANILPSSCLRLL